jgi:hypothetical protein
MPNPRVAKPKPLPADAASRVLQLRIAGGDYDNIVQTLAESENPLKVTREQCETFVDEELVRLQRPDEDTVQLDLARLDVMLAALWPKVRAGDVKAATEVGKIMDRKADLLDKVEPGDDDELKKVRKRRERRLAAS